MARRRIAAGTGGRGGIGAVVGGGGGGGMKEPACEQNHNLENRSKCTDVGKACRTPCATFLVVR